MRCLLIAPSSANLAVLLDLLKEQDVAVLLTSEVGAGTALAQVPFDNIDFGIAVISSGIDGRPLAQSAIYFEVGMAAGRGLPLFIIVEPPNLPSPALIGIATVNAMVDNIEALQLNLNLFLRSAKAVSDYPGSYPQSAQTLSIMESFRSRLVDVRAQSGSSRGMAFEHLVSDVFRNARAQIEDRFAADDRQNVAGTPDYGVDLVASIPGQEKQLGTLIIECKSARLTSNSLRAAQEQLSRYVINSRSGLGLLIYLDATVTPKMNVSTPLVITVGVDELLDELDNRPLGEVLIQARNRAVHGM